MSRFLYVAREDIDHDDLICVDNRKMTNHYSDGWMVDVKNGKSPAEHDFCPNGFFQLTGVRVKRGQQIRIEKKKIKELVEEVK